MLPGSPGPTPACLRRADSPQLTCSLPLLPSRWPQLTKGSSGPRHSWRRGRRAQSAVLRGAARTPSRSAAGARAANRRREQLQLDAPSASLGQRGLPKAPRHRRLRQARSQAGRSSPPSDRAPAALPRDERSRSSGLTRSTRRRPWPSKLSISKRSSSSTSTAGEHLADRLDDLSGGSEVANLVADLAALAVAAQRIRAVLRAVPALVGFATARGRHA